MDGERFVFTRFRHLSGAMHGHTQVIDKLRKRIGAAHRYFAFSSH